MKFLNKLQIRNHEFVWGSRTYLMGVVNATPDSFSGDGITDPVLAVEQAQGLIANGADVVDLGGESTRPGHTQVDTSIELDRVIPVVKLLRSKTDVVISIDSSKSEVIEAALDAGADIVNPVFGLTDSIKSIVLELELPIVIMHNQEKSYYDTDVVDVVLKYLSTHAEELVRQGHPQHKIILDPGIGFGKSPANNIQILHSLHKLTKLGFPTLIGTSRKSFIGHITGQLPNQRIFGTAATVALAIASGVDIVRVHDIAAMQEVVKVSDAIVRIGD